MEYKGKNMQDLPKREDEKYKEIERFKDYELSNNIAYEMMIRNDEYKRDALKVLVVHLESINEEMRTIAKDIAMQNNLKSILDENKNLKKISYEHRSEFFESIESKHGIRCNEMLYNDIDENNTFFGVQRIKDIEGNRIQKEDIEGLYQIETSKVSIPFKRPKIRIKHLSKVATIEINLSLPKNELIAYIAKLKDIANEEIKYPLELLGIEIQKADNLMCDNKGKCFDGRNILSKQQKIADLFYIYDALSSSMTQRKVQNEIYNYYQDLGIDTITMDIKTLVKYKDMASEYINNKRYRELITGVKE